MRDKSKCCNENTIKYSSTGVEGDVNTHYTCTNCGKISDKTKKMSKEKRWRCPIKETPPKHKDLLVKSPDGVHSISHYREGYDIFTCQTKRESVYGWQYLIIEELNQNKDDE